MNKHPIGLNAELTGASPEQRQVYQLIADGPRGSVPKPFLAMLDAPALAAVIQQIGVAIRFEGGLPDDQRELAILATAGAVGCGYEWNYHAPLAKQAGVPSALIAATLTETVPAEGNPEFLTIITLCRAAARTRRLPEDLLQTAIGLLGRRATTELIAIAGYYGLLASFIFNGGHDHPADPAILQEWSA